MDAGEQAALVIFLLLLLLGLIYLCCYKDKKLVHPVVKWRYYKSLFSTGKGEFSLRYNVFTIKRSEQDNPEVRNTEDKIIWRMKLPERTWAPEIDDGQKPVLVFCVYASRIGTDIESALRGVRNPHPVVVVLHCVNKSSLRGDLSDDDYLLEEALRNRIAGIAHFAFSYFDGFYSCRQNDDGLEKLRGIITGVNP